MLSALLLCSTLVVGCSPETVEETQEAPESLYFEPIGYGQRASVSDTLELAFRDHASWTAYRDSLVPIAPFDTVDFSQAIVLLVALPQLTSGHSIEIVSVDQFETNVVAEYVVNIPSEDCLTAYSENVPFQAVLVRRTELPVSFTHTTEEYRCTFGPRRRS